MASGTQQGATHARVIYSDASGTVLTGWTGDVVLPVVDESYGPNQKAYVGFHPFASHVIVADHFGDAYEVYIDAIADHIGIDDDTLKDYIVGHDSEGNPEYTEVEWSSGGEAVDTAYVTLYEIPLAAIPWLYRPALVVA
jgi:hypothetical protein